MKLIFVALLLCLSLAACGDESSPNPTSTVFPSTTTASPDPPEQALVVPDRDLFDLAKRFGRTTAEVGEVARTEPYGYAEGDSEQFYVIDLADPRIISIEATARRITDHAYFFVASGENVSDSALQQIGDDFESIVYPTVTAAFGPEWSPGVDSDQRITILHADLSGAGGYFSSTDEHPVAIVPRSNEREMLYLTSGALESPGAGYNALVAHELQHLVHWHADATEDSWVNEGLSEVAAGEVSGGGASGGVELFLQNPDTQLTFWPSIGDSSINYAASNLFFRYLLDQYGGRDRAIDLLAEETDSTEGVDAYLQQFGKTFEDVFTDWVVANYVNAPEGPYSHEGTSARVEALGGLSPSGSAEVGQYAADYLDARNAAAGSVVVFDGSDTTDVGVPERSGPFWWSNRGDGIDTRLTREFDLSGVDAATLRFATWYEIEDGWDYGYVAVSTDGGNTWTALQGNETTDDNPVEAAYGPGYTGESDGWVEEEVDLSAFAGRKVLVRFEYVSDDATSFTGLAIDDIEVPEIGYVDDASTTGGWDPEGFVRVTGPLEQRFIVQKIEGTRENPVVTRIELDDKNRAEFVPDGPAVIVVSGATPNTAEKATYSWELRTP